MNKEFRFKVVELLGKSALQIQLEVAIGYFVNDHSEPRLNVSAQDAWKASKYFMEEMEKAYSAIEEIPPVKLTGRELAADGPAGEDERKPEDSHEDKLEE